MRDLLLFGIILLSAVVAIGRPVFGILVFVCLGFLNPHSFTWAFARELPLSQYVAIGTLAGFVFWNESKRFPLFRESYFLLALWAIFGFSTIFAIYPDQSQTRLISISKIFLMVFIVTSLINTEHRFLQKGSSELVRTQGQGIREAPPGLPAYQHRPPAEST